MARLRTVAGWVGAAIAGVALAGFLFAWSGVYNIAASQGHWAVVEWVLEFGMTNSVERRAWAISVPPLDDADMHSLGAAHFYRACSHCHGAPGIQGDLTVKHALPPPPDLTHVSHKRKDNELFWIVKHGIKYTGMPSWVVLERDDEIWAVVAFLKKLPGMSRDEYRRLAIGTAETPAQSGRDIARVGVMGDVVGACARCHGAEQRGPANGLVPVLHGQPREFLVVALQGYAAGRRASGIMQPVAAELAPDTIDKLAAYYSSLASPVRSVTTAGQTNDLATAGNPAAGIPACTGCHDSRALAVYPRLAGQNAAYMANRLGLWKKGLPPSTDGEAIMAPIARLLNEQQIAELSAYFAALSPEREPGRQP